jgi:hypothetical protein
MAVWNRLQSLVFGSAIGAAGATAIEPQIEPARQRAWSRNKNKILDPGTAAQMVAQAIIALSDAVDEAGRNGYDEVRTEALIQLALRAVPYSEALELWRRGKINEADVDHALAKSQIDARYWMPLKELFYNRLDAPVIALAIVRGIMADPGFLPVGPPTTEGKIKAFPTSPLDPLVEAKAQGIDRDRLFVETAIAGRPMGPESAAHAVFRSIIEKVDYQRAIAEGDVRNEWAEAIFEAARAIPSATNFVEGRLRGWIDDAAMNAGTARQGMSPDDTHLLFQIHGRPPSWHQIWIGLQRGGTYDGPLDVIAPAFLKGLQESDLRPEWYNLLWHSRYNYPTAFVLRSLAEAGDITEAQAHEILGFEGWEPTLAATVAAKWANKTSTAKGNPWIAKAEQHWWTAAQKSFVKDGVLRTVIEPIMVTFVPDLADRDAIFQWWTDTRAIEAGTLP